MTLPTSQLADALPRAVGIRPEGVPPPVSLRASHLFLDLTLPSQLTGVGGTYDVGAGAHGEGATAPTNLLIATVDAGPIIEWVQRRGGISHVLGTEQNRWGETTDAPRSIAKDPELQRLSKRWYRMVKRGYLTVDAADKWCIEVLGVNPALVYGQEWWDVA